MKKISSIILVIGASLVIASAAFAFGGYHMGTGWGGHMMPPGYHMTDGAGFDHAPGYGPHMGWSQGPQGRGYVGPDGGYCWGFGNWQQPGPAGQALPAPDTGDTLNR